MSTERAASRRRKWWWTHPASLPERHTCTLPSSARTPLGRTVTQTLGVCLSRLKCHGNILFCLKTKPTKNILNGGTKEEKSNQNLTVFIAPAYGTCTVQALLSSTLPPNCCYATEGAHALHISANLSAETASKSHTVSPLCKICRNVWVVWLNQHSIKAHVCPSGASALSTELVLSWFEWFFIFFRLWAVIK